MGVKTLDVFYKGRQVGTLAETEDKRIAFQYSDDWIKNGFSISPFSLPLKSDVYVPDYDTFTYFKGLFGVFADSLPDSWGELLLDRTLTNMGIDRDSLNTLERLSYIGNSGMGALEYYPSKTTDYSIKGLSYDEIAAECKNILESKPSEKLDLLYNLGGPSGGTRPKILIDENGEDYIIKFPASRDEIISGIREYEYSLCAKKAGIIMTDTFLVPSEISQGYFKTKRFDRDGKEKIFSITFAGLLEADFRAPTCDYSTYMRLINALTKENKKQIEQMFRIMCFNIYSHNLDDHTKNFSFLFKDDIWSLAPAYDLTYSETHYGEHTTSVDGKGTGIKDEDLINIGVKAGLKYNRCKVILNEIKECIPMIDKYLARHTITRNSKIDIKDRIKEVKDNNPVPKKETISQDNKGDDGAI